MSIKGFLEAKEMQTGGMLQQSFTGPFANQSRRDPSGAEYIPPSYAPPKPPTIALPPITPLPPAAPTAEEIAQLDPGNVGSHADYNYNVTDAIAGAAKAGMGPLTPAQIGMLEPSLAASLAAYVQPETAVSRTLDATIGQALLVTPEGRLGYSLAAGTGPVGLGALATQRGLTGETLTDQVSRASAAVTSLFSDSKPATTTPLSAAVQNSAQQFAAVSKSTAPVGYTYPGGGFGATVTPASTTLEPTTPTSARQAIAAINQTPAPAPAPAVTAAQVGSDKALFGASFGQGRGGKGMFSSFDHYAAGINEGEEASIVAMGINSGAFANTQEGADTVGSMVSQGYDQNGVVAVASGMGTQPGQADYDFGAPSGGGGDGKGIVCTQMYQTTGHADWEKAMKLWYIYQVKYLTPLHQEGYHYLFGPFVKGMKKSRVLTSIGAYFAKHRTNQIKHELFKVSPFDVVGKLTNLFLHPTVYVAGKFKNLMENKTNA